MEVMLRQTAQAVRKSVALLKRTEKLVQRSTAKSSVKIKQPDNDIDQSTS
jgi:hypothetical protein